ncbi:MAG: carboxypeptidase regulatory-like domain-containing protein, partial [Acidobacteria bacterium]|nr:carboxypeptidase regulatory-like domain-containing protein [Acidobacteriota bacterium]
MSRFILLLFVCVCALLAQSPLGTITGLAVDPAQSAVTGAAVTLTSVETGVKRESSTNESGAYTFPNLPPGRYKLSATAKGFRALETNELIVAAYRTVRQDLRFEIQATSTEVTIVESISSVVQTDSPSITGGLTSKQLIELP